MFIRVVFPRIDQHGRVVCQRCAFTAQAERAVRTARLDQDVAVVMGVPNQRRIHVKQGHATEAPLKILMADDTLRLLG